MNHTNQIRNIVAKSRNLQTERELREAKTESVAASLNPVAAAIEAQFAARYVPLHGSTSDAAAGRARELAWQLSK